MFILFFNLLLSFYFSEPIRVAKELVTTNQGAHGALFVACLFDVAWLVWGIPFQCRPHQWQVRIGFEWHAVHNPKVQVSILPNAVREKETSQSKQSTKHVLLDENSLRFLSLWLLAGWFFSNMKNFGWISNPICVVNEAYMGELCIFL